MAATSADPIMRRASTAGVAMRHPVPSPGIPSVSQFPQQININNDHNNKRNSQHRRHRSQQQHSSAGQHNFYSDLGGGGRGDAAGLNYHVQRLEQTAAALSESGSDLGDEIRKMNRLSREGSLRSSLDSVGASRGEGETKSVIASPGSGRRNRSSGLAGNGGVIDEEEADGVFSSQRNVEWPLTGSIPVAQAEENNIEQGQREQASSSFARQYDEVADDFSRQEQQSAVAEEPVQQNPSTLNVLEGNDGSSRRVSTDTLRELELAFQDFDGVHFNPQTEELIAVDSQGNEVQRVPARNPSGALSAEAASMLRMPSGYRHRAAPPPPAEGMVYYPAPVPRMLNLPKRLSQLPSAHVQAMRRSQVLGQMAPGARESAPWLEQRVGGALREEENDNGNLQSEGPVKESDSSNNDKNNNANVRSHAHRRSGSSSVLPSGPGGPTFLNERMSTNLSNLPPQLRASVYFDHPSVHHDVQIQGESAVATLDSILAASATAPVNSFIDHPFAGDVRQSVYGMDTSAAQRRSTVDIFAGQGPASPGTDAGKAKRRSSLATLLKRRSTDEIGGALKKKGSRASVLTRLDSNAGVPTKLRKRSSRMSLGDELERQQTEGDDVPARRQTPEIRLSAVIDSIPGATPAVGSPTMDPADLPSRPLTAMSAPELPDSELLVGQDALQEQDEEQDMLEADLAPVYAQPTTLLAELQVRKAQLKSRNRTAATAFPRGMHSTLLQLDAVEEVAKTKRKKVRTALAWEDPNAHLQGGANGSNGNPLQGNGIGASRDDDDNDDVPLGFLYPSRDGLLHKRQGDERDWERPLGLMEKRALEDEEPLSSRQSRLRGGPPKGRASSMPRRPDTGLGLAPLASNMVLNGDGDGEAGEQEDEADPESLAQRMRRMKTKDALDTAIADVVPSPRNRSSGGATNRLSNFTDDVLSQFGGLDIQDTDKQAQQDNKASASQPPLENETLGQRRARLQREGGDQSQTQAAGGRPALASRSSLANLLSNNPTGIRAASKNYTPPQGSLLHGSAQAQAKQKSALLQQNLRSSSWEKRPQAESPRFNGGDASFGGLLGDRPSGRAPNGGFAGGLFNDGTGGVMGGSGGTSPQLQQQQQAHQQAHQQQQLLAMMQAQQRQQQQMQAQMQMQQQQQQQQGFYNPFAYNTNYHQAGYFPQQQQQNFGYPYTAAPTGQMQWQAPAHVPMGAGGMPPMMGTGMGMGMGMGNTHGQAPSMVGMGAGMQEAPLHPTQRAAIDRWRMDIAQ